ncbi:MAG: iron-containing alcohol dehydrogenase, partial [Anaeromyxobacteraceae bacterium]
RFLVRAVRDGHDQEARAQMMIAAVTGAAAFQKGLGAAHALAHALGPVSNVHHGLANAIVLPYVMEFNLGHAQAALAEVAVALGEQGGGEEDQLARRAIERVRAMSRDAGIPQRLRDVGVKESQLPLLTEKAFEDASHQANPRPCQPADLAAMLSAAY